jgi:hypothetical protein
MGVGFEVLVVDKAVQSGLRALCIYDLEEMPVHIRLELAADSIQHSKGNAQRCQYWSDHRQGIDEICKRHTKNKAGAELTAQVQPLHNFLHECLGFMPEFAQFMLGCLRQVELTYAFPYS